MIGDGDELIDGDGVADGDEDGYYNGADRQNC